MQISMPPARPPVSKDRDPDGAGTPSPARTMPAARGPSCHPQSQVIPHQPHSGPHFPFSPLLDFGLGASGAYKMTERKDTGLQLCGHNRKCSHRERRGHSGRSKARRAANRTAALWAGRDPCTACQELPRAPPFGAESAPLRTRKTLLCLRKGATGRRKKGGWHQARSPRLN